MRRHIFANTVGRTPPLHIAVLDFLVIWVWKSRQSMQRPNGQQQRLSSWAINYTAPGRFLLCLDKIITASLFNSLLCKQQLNLCLLPLLILLPAGGSPSAGRRTHTWARRGKLDKCSAVGGSHTFACWESVMSFYTKLAAQPTNMKSKNFYTFDQPGSTGYLNFTPSKTMATLGSESIFYLPISSKIMASKSKIKDKQDARLLLYILLQKWKFAGDSWLL